MAGHREVSEKEQAIEVASRNGILLQVKQLIHDLNLVRNLSTEAVISAIKGQYYLAVKRKAWNWWKELRRFGAFLLEDAIMDKHFPCPWRRGERDTREETKDSRQKSLEEMETETSKKEKHLERRPEETITYSRQRSLEEREEDRRSKKERNGRRLTGRRHSRSRSLERRPEETMTYSRQRSLEEREEDRGSWREKRVIERRHSRRRSLERRPEETITYSRQRSLEKREEDRGLWRERRHTERRHSGSRSAERRRNKTINYARPRSPEEREDNRGSIRERRLKGVKFGSRQGSLEGKERRSKRFQSPETSEEDEWHPRQQSLGMGEQQFDQEFQLPESLVFYRSGCDSRTSPEGVRELTIKIDEGRRSVGMVKKRRLEDEVPCSRKCKKPKRTKCPFAGCDAIPRRVKRHVQQQHIPAVFHDLESEDLLRIEAFQAKRLEALQILAEKVMAHQEDPTPESLRKMVDWNVCIDSSSEITPATQKAMRLLCEHAGWEVPKSFTLVPINSPAALMHWRPMAFIMEHLNKRNTTMMFDRFGYKTRRRGSELLTSHPMEVESIKETTQGTEGVEEQLKQEMSVPMEIEHSVSSVASEVVKRLETKVISVVSDTGNISMNSLEAFKGAKAQRGILKLVLEESPDRRSLELDYHCSPSPDKGGSLTKEEEEALLMSDTEAPASQGEEAGTEELSPKIPQYIPSYAEVVRNITKVGIVKPTTSPKINQVAQVGHLLKAFDSHFHPDRLGERIDVSVREVDRMAQKISTIEPAQKVDLVGGVMVYCDPERYSEIFLEAENKWRIAVGVHPKKVHKLNSKDKEVLKTMIMNPRVAALGEIGLDYSVEVPTREVQKKMVNEILALSRPDKVVVTHLRGNEKDTYAREPSGDLPEIIKSVCPMEQKLHLHCFSGGMEQVREWRRVFPDCCFGFTGKVIRFRKPQREALRSIPLDRILLETDSPYLSVHRGQPVNTPAYIGDVAAEVAKVRQEPVAMVLQATTRNGQRLYGQ